MEIDNNSIQEQLLESDFNRDIFIEESSLKIDAPQLKSLTDLFNFNHFILLGDPGIGKTFSFECAAIFENAEYRTVDLFRVTKGRNCQGKILYLDGLDEYRSRNDEKSLIFDLIDIIQDVEPLKIRISCRSADWLGASDTSKFKAIFNGNYAVATLQSLTVNQQSKLILQKGITDTDTFFDEAEKHGLDNLLGNPQTLIMMTEVIRSGRWPESKIELFERSCEKLLAEHDSNRTRSGSGEYKSRELLDAAGAICASILISNTHSISLLGEPHNSQIPSYREITFCDDKKLLATLTRRAFTSTDIINESLTYIHRTIAEYLAAKWIAKLINEGGLPLNRIKNIIGYNDIPSSELRGIHAWISVLISDDFAQLFIESDPLGTVLYSDPSNLNVSNKVALIKALEKLSIEDPWFLSQHWSNRNLGAFSSEELADEFIKILFNPNSTHQLKELVLGALRYGKPIFCISKKLIEFLNNDCSSIQQKIDTVQILSLMGKEQKEYLANIFYLQPSIQTDEYIPLQIVLIKTLYPDYLFSEDVSNLIRNLACADMDDTNWDIWGLDKIIRVDDLANVIDQSIEKLKTHEAKISDRDSYRVQGFLECIVKSAIENQVFSTPEKIWGWLKYLYRFPKYGHNHIQDEYFSIWVDNNIKIVDSIFEYSFKLYDNPYRWHNDFNGVFNYPYSHESLTLKTLKILIENKDPKNITLDFYSYISGLIFNYNSEFQSQAFKIWYEYAEEHLEFLEKRKNLLICSLDGWEYKNALSAIKNKKEILKRQNDNRKNVGLTIDQIRNGEHLQNIGFLAYEYFRDLTKESKPVDTLIEKFGIDFLPDILLGFKSVLLRDDLPSARYILHSKGRYYHWWLAILAAVNESFEKDKTCSNIKPSLLETGYALSKVFPVFHVKDNNSANFTLEWVEYYCTYHNNDFKKILIELIEEEIKLSVQHSTYLYELKTNESTKDWRPQEAFLLLKKYPNTRKNIVLELLSFVLNNNKFEKNLSILADQVLNKKGYLKGDKRAIWLVVDFLISPDTKIKNLKNYSKTRSSVVWIIRDLTDKFLNNSKITGKSLNETQLETLIYCCGLHYENSRHPSNGWSGSQNNWDASDFIKSLFNQLSAYPTELATSALENISKNKNLVSYENYSLHSLANQKRSYAESHYFQPDWQETLSILSNIQPTNNIDLFSLVHDHLITIQKLLIGSNTDIYKRFWRHGQNGTMIEPDIEDLCRDRLIEVLKPKLSNLGLSTEREFDMANHKRADIVVLNSELKLPLELKKDTHKDVWKSLNSQLKRLYTIDPNASGYGLYVVFWFGVNRKGKVPKPPDGIKNPSSCEEMENSLKSLISDCDRGKLEVIVLDCSLPD